MYYVSFDNQLKSYYYFFFFSSRRRHTRFDCDWSSDVCSSDLRSLQAEIERSMRDVRAACADWPKMQSAARQAAEDLNSLGSRFDVLDITETQALLEWMLDRHFTFLGYREYRLQGTGGRVSLQPVEASG